MTQEADLRQEMCDVGRRLWDRHLVGACEGNLSARLDDTRLLATPSGSSLGSLAPETLVLVDRSGRSLSQGQPSSEIALHTRIYNQRPDCQAVVHAHPVCATAFSVAGVDFPDDVLCEAAYVLGPVACVPFGVPGTEDLPNKVEPFLKGHKTLLLSHHGAVSLGRNLWDACNRMETLERLATLLMHARALGKINPLPETVFTPIREAALHGSLV